MRGRSPRIMETGAGSQVPFRYASDANAEAGHTKKQTGSRWSYDPISDFIFRSNYISTLAAGKGGGIAHGSGTPGATEFYTQC